MEVHGSQSQLYRVTTRVITTYEVFVSGEGDPDSAFCRVCEMSPEEIEQHGTPLYKERIALDAEPWEV